MRASNVGIYVHIIWATWDRLPNIDGAVAPVIYGSTTRKGRDLDCDVIAVGGVADHVHLLVNMSPSICVSELMQRLKGCSSLEAGRWFKWQGTYYAKSVASRDIPRLVHYINNQEAHHIKSAKIGEGR